MCLIIEAMDTCEHAAVPSPVLFLFQEYSDQDVDDYCGDMTESESSLPSNCLQLLCQGYTDSGVYRIYPRGQPHYFIDAYCDQKTGGGGWTVGTCTRLSLFAALHMLVGYCK